MSPVHPVWWLAPRPAPFVAGEVLVEKDIVFPVRIFLELLASSIHRAAPLGVPQENTRKPNTNFLGDFKQSQHVAGAGGAFHLEVVAVKLLEIYQCSHQEAVHGHPNRSAPIGVSSERPRVRLRR
jgi:hypothetical protein